jgi:K+-transporting ATPase ATPase C chain
MLRSVSKSLWLLTFAVVLVCGVYPGILWAIGQSVFPFQANGSILKGPDGKPVGSLLIAQPFTKDEYFQPRPSAVSYNATASSSSALAVSNYALRDRVARQIGPVATYADGPKQGQLVAPDVETWFKADKFAGSPGIVQQWADAHNSLAQAWVTGDPTHGPYVDAWSKAHPDLVAAFIKANPSTPKPQASDLAVTFFERYSKDHPGTFPSQVTTKGPDGKDVTSIGPVATGSDVDTIFFEMWREDHPNVALQNVPGDWATTSGSGLDPHITLDNAEFQLPRVAGKWAQDLKRDPAAMKAEIDGILKQHAFSPGAGLFGEPIVNVLEVNLELRKRYGAPS